MITNSYVTDSEEALAASAVEGAEVWIHGSITYVTNSPKEEEVTEEPVQKKPKKN